MMSLEKNSDREFDSLCMIKCKINNSAREILLVYSRALKRCFFFNVERAKIIDDIEHFHGIVRVH